MPDIHGLTMFVLYNDTTSDYPGEWVVRRQAVTEGGQIEKDTGLSARGSTREECMDDLYSQHPEVRGMAYLRRAPNDDPVIAGVFL